MPSQSFQNGKTLGWFFERLYTVATQAEEDLYTHIELLNSDWYHIEPYKYQGHLFWITQKDWIIDSASTLHPTNFTSPTAYHPPTKQLDQPKNLEESSVSNDN
jgi:hypothetical protein